jgi:glycosyltransferase involved in cell wall biosynthesis
LRIVQLAQVYFPWLGYQEFYLARELTRLGHDVVVISSDRGVAADARSRAHVTSGPKTLPAGESADHGVRAVRLQTLATVGGRLLLRGVSDAIRAHRPDVVHAHGYLVPLTAQAAATTSRLGIRLVVDEHQLPYVARAGAIHDLQRRTTAMLARKWLLPRIDALVPIADGARDWLIDGYGCPPDRVAPVIPLGADVDVFRPDLALRAKRRRDIGAEDADVVVLSTGKIAPHKRIDLLVDALAMLGDPRVFLVLVGDAEPGTARELTAQAARSAVRLRILPGVPHDALPGFFNAADICAWPADCTISHLEAAACGKPIVIPDERAIADRVSAGNGLVARIGDIAGLARAVSELAGDEVQRRNMGARGRSLIEQRYAWRSIALQWLDVYARPQDA